MLFGRLLEINSLARTALDGGDRLIEEMGLSPRLS